MVIYSERCVAESNRLKWFCRPVPDRSDNAPCFINFSKVNAKVVLLFLLSKYFVYFLFVALFFLVFLACCGPTYYIENSLCQYLVEPQILFGQDYFALSNPLLFVRL